jgi:hypothetical protein
VHVIRKTSTAARAPPARGRTAQAIAHSSPEGDAYACSTTSGRTPASGAGGRSGKVGRETRQPPPPSSATQRSSPAPVEASSSDGEALPCTSAPDASSGGSRSSPPPSSGAGAASSVRW